MIFASPPAAKAVVALVLIENSQRILEAWNDLRLHYLPTLLRALREANPVLHITVLWLTTAPVGDDPASIHATSRQYNQLPDLKFSFGPDNKVSSRIIYRATELMLDAATHFQGAPVGFHLFVVAASPPTLGTWGVSVTMPSQIGQSEWRLLAQRLAQFGIHCHMILTCPNDMAPMHELFTTTLELEGNTQVSPWFPVGPDYTLLLSGNPPAPDPPAIDQVSAFDGQPHFSRPRHQSLPQDVSDSTPSLVTSLQKVHGLSRKKIYGTQPPRQPFVREEPVRAKYKSTPTPLSIPEDGRKTKSRRPTTTESGRRGSWSRDLVSSPTSPTGSLSPTILPVYTDLTSTPYSLADPSAGGYFALPLSSPAPVPAPSPAWPASKPKRHSQQQQQQQQQVQSLDAMSSKYRLDAADPRPKNAHKVKDAGDVPFIFSPELEAATAAKLKAALSTTPVVGPMYVEDTYVQPSAGYAEPSSSYANGVAALEPRFTSSSLQGWAG